MASFTVPCPKCSSFPTGNHVLSHQHNQHSKISFHVALNSRFPLISGSATRGRALFGSPNIDNQSSVSKLHAQLKEVAADKTPNSAPVTQTKLSEGKNESPEKLSTQNTVPDASAISEFMSQVSDLVKLVDSRDIMELQLKQLDCELIIRKKEALLPPPQAAPVITMQSPMHHSMLPSQPLPPQAVSSPAPPAAAPSAPAPPSPASAKPSKSAHPPLKCPMAGTFYRSPAPAEPPFVKVGDKVQKGQVICIIEAMKLMNEIEADQSGTIAEILVEDGKSVSVDMPLFVIAP